MNSNWRNRPTTIDYVSGDIDYVISIDESGNSNLKQVLKSKKMGKPAVDSEKHFTVTACLLNLKNFEIARDLVMAVKKKHWDNAIFDYKGVKKRVCFHSREIRGRKEAFSSEIIDYATFIEDLSELMNDIPMTIYAAHIDKEQHVNKYVNPASPYDLCMTFVLERIMMNIKKNETCIVVLEARGGKEDKTLLNQIKRLIDYGNQYNSADMFSKIKGVYFNPKWCRSEHDQKSYWELELADLCAYPIQKYFLYGTEDKAFQTLKPKIACFPNVWGQGLKSFP